MTRSKIVEMVARASVAWREYRTLMEAADGIVAALDAAGALRVDNEPLKACPLCGSDAEFFKHADGLYRIRCVNVACGATLDGWSKTESAVKAWNRRVGYGW